MCSKCLPPERAHDLRQRLLNVWSSTEQDVIDTSIDQWRLQLKTCMHLGGRHFEHML